MTFFNCLRLWLSRHFCADRRTCTSWIFNPFYCDSLAPYFNLSSQFCCCTVFFCERNSIFCFPSTKATTAAHHHISSQPDAKANNRNIKPAVYLRCSLGRCVRLFCCYCVDRFGVYCVSIQTLVPWIGHKSRPRETDADVSTTVTRVGVFCFEIPRSD